MKDTLSPDLAVRPAACAGRFYTADPTRLRLEVCDYIAAAKVPSGPAPKAIIAPHAGYMYSGPIAGSAYACLKAGRDVYRRVVLIGPSHYSGFLGLAASSMDAFATPLGVVLLDKGWLEKFPHLHQVHPFEEAHQPEHCLEVQLPFLQCVLREFVLVPLLVGEASDEETRQVLECLWGGPETLVVVSSDLSHYHNYRKAQHMDQCTSRAIEALQSEGLSGDFACGSRAIRGFLRLAHDQRLSCQTVDLRNSGDTAGSRDRVVGYGAYVFTDTEVSQK